MRTRYSTWREQVNYDIMDFQFRELEKETIDVDNRCFLADLANRMELMFV